MDEYLARAFTTLAPVLKSLGMRYPVVGSLASGARGQPRATADGDVLVQILPPQARILADALGKDWYAEPDEMERAIRAGWTFNIIHIPTASKIDLFPARSDFHLNQLERTSELAVFDEMGPKLPVISPEDVILSKLEWYAAGGEVSEKQWMDILGVFTMQPSLDMDYLNAWAVRLGVSRLLARALDEARSDT